MRTHRSILEFVSVVAIFATLLVVPGPGRTATAATELSWFTAAPGVIRTNLEADEIEFDPVSGLIYGAVSEDAGIRLIVIDPDSLEVNIEATLPGVVGDVHDIAVSRDGQTLFVASSDLVSTLRANDLNLIEQYTTSVTYSPARLVVSPDRPDRFALVSPTTASRLISIYDGGELVDESLYETAGNLGFGATSDTFFIAGLSEWVHRYEFTPAGVVQTALVAQEPGAYGGRTGKLGVFYRAGRLVLVRDYASTVVTVRDANSLAIIESIEIEGDFHSEQNVSFDHSSGRLVMETHATVSAVDVADLDGSLVQVKIPLDDRMASAGSVSGLAGLPASVVAVLEAGGGNKWLTIVSLDLLTSAFGEYHPVSPARILDTRKPIGVPIARPIGENRVVRLQVAGLGGVPPSGVLAAVVNVAVTDPTRAGYVSISASGSGEPEVSNLNFGPGQTLANAATVVLGPTGAVDVLNRWGDSDVIIDVVGYYSNIDGARGARYQAVDGFRVANTRDGTGLPGARRVGAGESIEFSVPVGWFSEPAVAAALNVTAIDGSSPSFLAVYPGDELPPKTASLNFQPGSVRGNLVITKVAPDGTVRIFNGQGEVDIIVDLFGLYVPHEGVRDQSGRFLPVRPFRDFDSRDWSPFDGTGELEPGSALISPNWYGYTDIINLTAASTTENGYLSVIGWSDDSRQTEPTTANVNFLAGEIVGNSAYATGQPDVAVFNPYGFTHIVIDVFGYLTPSSLRPIDQVWTD